MKMKKHIGQLFCIIATILLATNVSLSMVHFGKAYKHTSVSSDSTNSNHSNSFHKKVSTETLLIFEKDGSENESEILVPFSFLSDGFPLNDFFEFILIHFALKSPKTYSFYDSFKESSHVPYWLLDRSIRI